MSLVGNFAFNNADATESRSGAGHSPHLGRPLQPAEDSEHAIGLHHTSTQQSKLRRGTSESAVRPEISKNGATGPGPNYEIEKSANGDEKASENTIDEEDQRREAEVHALARKLTKQSSFSEIGDVNPFEAGEGSRLDPHSEHFNGKAWSKAVLNFHLKDPEAHPLRTASVAFRNLNVFGFGSATDYQKSVGNVLLELVGLVRQMFGLAKQRRIDILRDFEGVVHAGEMLVVLGPPGSGCSTLLKTISGEVDGLNIDPDSHLNYQGISATQMHKDFRGEAIYTAEVDVHFPMLTVGDTLTFAARARAPRHIPGGISTHQFSEHVRDVVMATFGISHTINTCVGNDFVRGVSGGERKRVTISEASLSGAALQCWDNSTRGLDSANAIEFCKTLRMSADIINTTACVAIYQAPQSAYDIFDKVIVLYEGFQIFFGKCDEARHYFEGMGFDCPSRQTTADFLTSMTSPAERVVRSGWSDRVPRTAQEFARRWKESPKRKTLMSEIDEYDQKYVVGGEYRDKFIESRRAQQAKHQRVKSPYTLSYVQQIKLCLWRGFQRLRGDPSLTFTQLFGNALMALVIGSVFYNLQPNTASFFQRGALLFFGILMNAFGSALEILTLYAQRPIVEKHARYAFYHPSAEAFASMLTDLPYKILNTITFNLVLYFMTNLRREPGPFFFFILMSFFLTLTMSMLFRCIASMSRTLAQAMAPAALIILAIVMFTGFAIPTRYMLGWSRWINYLDPVAYAFEALMINEFHGRGFECSTFVPSGPGYPTTNTLSRICTAVGSKAGSSQVNGDDYINSAFQYYHAHKWRNFGILIVFMVGLCVAYLVAAELVSAKKSKGEVLVFRRGAIAYKHALSDPEAAANTKAGVIKDAEKEKEVSEVIQKQTAIFSWKDVCYDIKIKGEERRILDHVDGWVKPGTLTALMGVSGAGKTTLLDALATRITMGVVSGEMLVDGRQRDQSFQRKTGYVQQQDLHLSTSTVREALNFSAALRQPGHVSRKDKLAYVDEVIKLLEMEEYAEAVVGVPGEGLNVEQRKRLTIGVELAAKPELLLFLDEPTSGLDSQTSWAICDLMEKLTRSGQAVLCTIHQPSAMLFQRFDRLLFLQKGGQTVYYGEIGENSHILTSYFERHGAPACPKDANPAEWMLEVIGAAPGSFTDIDWFKTWRESPEYVETHKELDRLKNERPLEVTRTATNDPKHKKAFHEFAAPFSVQMWEVLKRVFEQYWRTPSYIYSKGALCLLSALFIGFVFFDSPLSQQGLQNQMFAIFMLYTIFGQMVQQIMPHFVTQRSLYEARERPSKAYSWKAFILSNIIVELPWQTLMSVLMFVCWFYPVGMYRNTFPTDSLNSRSGLMFALIWVFMLFTSTFTHMCIAAIDTAEAGGNIANLIFSLCLIFCGVLAPAGSLPGFWIFMYRVSPFTYLTSAMLSTGLADSEVTCADNEYLLFQPANGQSCGTYMNDYVNGTSTVRPNGGYVLNPGASADCRYCTVKSTNVFLAQVSANFSNRWRDFGIMWVFIIFNVFAALFLYWLARVPKKARKGKKKTE
ncbi:hypothetical protein EJ08DRAFT_646484 [Tothia fuscella]|uniref:ABC transporter domain-containing protein n=1 Tax=Tothia fuscella TaxID=1048955 RepID=A0A9P4P0N6_9PEZI|nr:hypothetical protein EJ08DRAFT_646484 [Tothia fuscella]